MTDSSSWAVKPLWTVTAAMKSEDNCFLAGSYDKPRQCVEKQRHYSADKGLYNQGYGLPVATYACGSLTVKKAEHQRIDAFKLWCWRKLLRVPWTGRRSNPFNLKKNKP